MIQRRGGPRLTLEPLQRLPVVGEIFRKKLQRNMASQPLVLGAINHPHATLADGFHNAIMGDSLSEHSVLACGIVVSLRRVYALRPGAFESLLFSTNQLIS